MSERAGSVDSGTPVVHTGRGGARPTPALTYTWHLHDGQTEDAFHLIRQYHYSHRAPTNIQLCLTAHRDGGLFGDFGEAEAAIYFSVPPTRWGEPVWELSRLVRTPECAIPLTKLISAACRWIARGKQMDLLVSFADSTQGHHGGIYQAASWNYDGKRDRRIDGCVVDGTFVPGRSCNSRWGTSSPRLLGEKLGRPVEPNWDEGKHLYWRSLNKNGDAKASALGLRSTPYPKPDITP